MAIWDEELRGEEQTQVSEEREEYEEMHEADGDIYEDEWVETFNELVEENN